MPTGVRGLSSLPVGTRMFRFSQVFIQASCVVRKVAPCPDCSRRLAVSPNAGRSVTGPCAESLLPPSSCPCCWPSSSEGCASRTTSTPRASSSQAADTVLVIRPVVEYNLAVQRLAAAESVGGGGVISAITKYESAAADLRIALKARRRPGVGEGRAARAPCPSARPSARAKTQSGFSDVVIDKSGNIATLMSTAVSDLGLQRRLGLGQDRRRPAGHHRRPARHDR